MSRCIKSSPHIRTVRAEVCSNSQWTQLSRSVWRSGHWGPAACCRSRTQRRQTLLWPERRPWGVDQPSEALWEEEDKREQHVLTDRRLKKVTEVAKKVWCAEIIWKQAELQQSVKRNHFFFIKDSQFSATYYYYRLYMWLLLIGHNLHLTTYHFFFLFHEFSTHLLEHSQRDSETETLLCHWPFHFNCCVLDYKRTGT